MVTYICSICDKIFNDKYNYTTHLKKKFPCKKKESNKILTESQNTNFKEKEYKCYYCNKLFTTNSNWNRHVKINCKIKKKQENEKELTYNKLIDEFEKMKNDMNELKKQSNILEKKNKELENMLKKTNVNQYIENQNNIENQNVININLIAYGREDLSKIDTKFIFEALQRGTSCIPVLTERIHFNIKYPEFQNVYIPNMGQQYCMVYDGNKWLLKDKNTVIDYIYSQSYDHLDNNFKDFFEKLPVSK